jgi:putative chitinase
LEDPIYASLSACAWWVKRIGAPFNINNKAERKDIKAVTKVVNGGYNHLAERTAVYQRALKAYNIT